MGIRSLDDVFQFRLTLGQGVEVGVFLGVGGVDALQFRQGVERVAQAFLDIAPHILVRVQLRLLGQIAHLYPRLGAGLAEDVRVQPRHDFQQGRFARAVQAQHADLGAGEEGQRNVLENGALRGDDLAHPFHRIYILCHKSSWYLASPDTLLG